MHLKQSSILAVPFNIYEKDFSFIVNGEEFKTSRIIADLLSPIISRNHLTDPTINTYTINTQYSGDFSQILKLLNFESMNITNDDIPFFSEVIEKLGYGFIEFDFNTDTIELTIDNVLNFLHVHEKNRKFYSQIITKEIAFVSSHFAELYENQEESMKYLSIETLIDVINNDQLRLENEDQLLKFVNELYSQNSDYSILYETVLFSNVSSENMKEFITIFDLNDISNSIWKLLSKRLCYEIDKSDDKDDEQIRYNTNNLKSEHNEEEDECLIFEYTKENEYKGIFNYIQTQSNDKIENEINFSSSSLWDNRYDSSYVTKFRDQSKTFYSRDEENSWICFDFNEHRIIPSHYTIGSRNWGRNSNHPKSWVIEGSEDNEKWDKIDEEIDCSFLNGKSLVHSFEMNNQINKKFKFIRMRSTGPDWRGKNVLAFESFEIYGKLFY